MAKVMAFLSAPGVRSAISPMRLAKETFMVTKQLTPSLQISADSGDMRQILGLLSVIVS